MSLSYNQEIFQKFRNMAITELEKIERGKTYFSNTYPYSFTVVDIVNDAGLDLIQGRKGCHAYSGSDNFAPKWIIYDCEKGNRSYMSLSDHNVGMSYNPWLIFDDEVTAENCRNELHINSYASTSSYDDEYDYTNDYDLMETY